MSNDSKPYACLQAVAIIIAIVCSYAFKLPGNDKGRLVLQINPVFNGQPLLLNDQYYIAPRGDSVYIEEFKFYISSLQLQGDRHFAEPNSFHLVDAEDTTSLRFAIDMPVGNYQSLDLNIGIDSATNMAGALGGALDPINGMYWAWNTGYINAKLTGHSNRCVTLHHAFEYHIGGYIPPYNTLRKVRLSLANAVVQANKTTIVTINADIAEWFKSPATIDITKTNSVVIPGKESMGMADNYADMLSVNHIADPQP